MKRILALDLFTRTTLFIVGLVAPLAAAPLSDPSLKPNDVITMQIFGEPDVKTTAKILKSGDVVLPLIGTVKVGGLTLSKATEEIRALYDRDYFVEPKVTMTVDDYAQEFVVIDGAVNKSGSVPIPADGQLDLAAALASAGGLSPRAAPDKILLKRAGEEKSTAYSEDSIRRGGGIVLRAGDSVFVGESDFIKKSVIIQGRVNKPGQLAFPLDGQLDLLTAINQAGGFHELANQRKVEINRKGVIIKKDVRELSEKGWEKVLLQPDDIITVKERW